MKMSGMSLHGGAHGRKAGPAGTIRGGHGEDKRVEHAPTSRLFRPDSPGARPAERAPAALRAPLLREGEKLMDPSRPYTWSARSMPETQSPLEPMAIFARNFF